MIGYSIGYAIISAIASSIISTFFYYVLSYKPQQLRDFYALVQLKKDEELLNMLKSTNNFRLKHLGLILIYIIILIFAFLLSFGFCSVYKTQQGAWILSIILALFIDLIIIALLIEFIAMKLYKNRDYDLHVKLLIIIERIRSYKYIR